MADVSKEEKDFFKRMLSAANKHDVENLTPAKSPINEDVNENVSDTLDINYPDPSKIDMDAAFKSLMGDTIQSPVETYNKNTTIVEEKVIPISETKNGYKIGEWEVDISRNPKTNKPTMYNILHSHTKKPIASVRVFEAADAITKNLNEGMSITEKPMIEVLELAEVYESHYNDCKRFKYLMNKAIKEGNQKKTDIYEARYQKSFGDLIKVKNKIKQRYV